MNHITTKNRKSLIFSVVVFLVVVMAGSIYVGAQSGTTFTLTGTGPYPGADDFTFYKSGSTYYAKTKYGSNPYYGTDAVKVLNDVDDALTSGGSVYFKTGTYSLGETWVIDNPITIRGDKDAVLQGSADMVVLVWFNSSNIKMYDIQVDGNNHMDHAVYLKGVSYCEVVNCEVYGSWEYGISVLGDGTNLIPASHNLIEGNYIHDITGDTVLGTAIAVSDHPTYTVVNRGNRVLNNYIEDVEEHGIKAYNPQQDIIIAGNIINSTGSTGISFSSGGLSEYSTGIISNNIVRNTTSDGLFLNAPYITVSNNQFYSIGGAGINVYNDHAGNDTFTGNIINTAVGYGFQIDSGNCVFSSNIVYSATRAFHVGGSNCTFTGNFANNIDVGFFMSNSLYNLIVGNTFRDVSGYSFTESGTANFNLLGLNTFSSSTNIAGANTTIVQSWVEDYTSWID